METDDQVVQWEGSGLMYARRNFSYGGEVYGIYLVCRFSSDMWPERLVYLGRVDLRCDNKSGVWDCTNACLKTRKMKKFRGLLRAIKKTLSDLKRRGLVVTIQHVKGHQDDVAQFDELSR